MTRLKLRVPPKGEVWLHIERLTRSDGKVWAIQYRGPRGGSRYLSVASVIVARQGYTQFWGPKALQPKAHLVFVGARVQVNQDGSASIY